MKNCEELIKACADCVCACKCAIHKLHGKNEALSQEERTCARMWSDCSAICEACIEFSGRNSPHCAELMKLCSTVCEGCEKECSKHRSKECSEVAKACKRCYECCNKCCSECRKCA